MRFASKLRRIFLAATLTALAASCALLPGMTHEEMKHYEFEQARLKAEAGDARAQAQLGSMYHVGYVQYRVAANYKVAASWYLKAAEQGDARGQQGLASLYEIGEGVEKDNGEAMRWYLKAASQSSAASQYKLGELHRTGTGVDRDVVQAWLWYERARRSRHRAAIEAQTLLEVEMSPEELATARRLRATDSR